MSFAIRVNNLGKRYQLGATHAGSIRELVNRTWKRLLGRKEQLLPHEQAQLQELGNGKATADGGFWALKDISFEVQPGEVIGIIGRNGSGKSTLLKILSDITAPTTGRVELHGRVASLLEVGTGFHPELSGRENVFLNGAILGMTKSEIRRKFDEIVAFAEIEKFIDTPVKRYSSGMYVRLAFAVAAHLEPEILIVDEVLAVGDAPFQDKCLGKMGEVSRAGRTILFVSHNMQAVRQLCNRAILLDTGSVRGDGKAAAITTAYLRENLHSGNKGLLTSEPVHAELGQITAVTFANATKDAAVILQPTDRLRVDVHFQIHRSAKAMDAAMALVHQSGVRVFSRSLSDQLRPPSLLPGDYCLSFQFDLQYLKAESYSLTVNIIMDGFILHQVEDIPLPEIEYRDMNPIKETHRWGVVLLPVEWSNYQAASLDPINRAN